MKFFKVKPYILLPITFAILIAIVFLNYLNTNNREEMRASGTAILDCEDLQNIKNGLSGTYYLNQDIDCSDTTTWNSGNGFQPIGANSWNQRFKGELDGRGFVVKNLYLSSSGAWVGVFAAMEASGVIKNIGFEDIDIVTSNTGWGGKGGVVGVMSGGEMSQVYVTGSVEGGEYVGGILGQQSGGTISDCYSHATITTNRFRAGGFIGQSSGGTITRSYAAAEMYLDDNLSWNDHGGFSGNQGNTVTNSFWDTDVSGLSSDGGTASATGEDTLGMQDFDTFDNAGWDIGAVVTGCCNDDYIWNIVDGSTYPYFNWQIDEEAEDIPPTIITLDADGIGPTFAALNGELTRLGTFEPIKVFFRYREVGGTSWTNTVKVTRTSTGTFNRTVTGLDPETEYEFEAIVEYGDPAETRYGTTKSFETLEDDSIPPPPGAGTSGNPYRISTLDHLDWIKEDSSRWAFHYIQEANINAADTENWDGGNGWTPIGNNTTKFTGRYNGQGYIISNLYINRSSTNYIGFFGYIANGGRVTNLGLDNVDITGGTYTGGLSGYTEGVWDATSNVENCFVKGDVSGGASVGGLVGYIAYQSYIANSYVEANISGSNTGIGGIGGSQWGGSIVNSYSASTIGGAGGAKGGIVGQSNATVTNSYWDTTIGPATSAGGTGRTSTQMKDIDTYSTWDIETQSYYTDEIWAIDNEIDYPRLYYEYQSSVILSVSIIDNDDHPIAHPKFSLNSQLYAWVTNETTGALGTSSQRILITNTTDTPQWNLSIAAKGGENAQWESTYYSHKYNGTEEEGRLVLDPQPMTITPVTGHCDNTGLTKQSEAYFDQGTVGSIDLLSSSSSSGTECFWTLENIDMLQYVPPKQEPDTYTLEIVLTIL